MRCWPASSSKSASTLSTGLISGGSVPRRGPASLRVVAAPANARVYVDDLFVGSARLLARRPKTLPPGEHFVTIRASGYFPHDLRLDMPEEEHAAFMDKVLAATSFDDAEVSTIDGLRVDFADSWGLIRPSNTTPCLVLRFEGDDEAALDRVKERFRSLLSGIDADLALPF